MKTTRKDLPVRLIDAETERVVLSAILGTVEAWMLAGPQLTTECFAVDSHRRLFVLMTEIAENGCVPDLSGCYNAVVEKTGAGSPESIGLPRLSELAWNGEFLVTNLKDWVNRLRRRAAERRSWRLLEQARLGIESGGGLAEVSRVRAELRGLEADFDLETVAAPTLGAAVSSIGIDTLLAVPSGVIALPWEALNRFTNGGPCPGHLWIVGARPSIGKSTVALQVALAAGAAGRRVLFASLEMPLPDLLKRIFSAEGSIPHGLLVRGDLDKPWRCRVAETLERIGGYPIEICDKIRSLQGIIAKAAATPGLELLIIDYLGLIDLGGRFENRNQEVSTISRRLKLAALDYGIPIIAAHQLNRGNDKEERPPRLSDLRDSGSLEQDADTVLLLDSPGTRPKSQEPKDALDITIAKQRNGSRGHSIKLRLEGQFCRIVEIDADRPASRQQSFE